MTDQELKDLVASLAVAQAETKCTDSYFTSQNR